MDEAVQAQMPCALRRLFTMLLLFCAPPNPWALWDKYYPSLSKDFSYQNGADSRKILSLTCIEIERYLEGMGKSMKDYNLDHLLDFKDTPLARNREINDALNAHIPSIHSKVSKQLNAEQRSAYKCTLHHVKTKTPGAFFIVGPGGTRKTFLYCALYAKVRSMGGIVLPTTTFGIAASNIPMGRIAHSRIKISINDDSPLSCNVSKQSNLSQLLRQATLIIWDEASMAKKSSIGAVDLLIQDICNNKTLFGGKVIVFGGDFRQVLLVLPRRTQQEAVDSSLVGSYLWPNLTKFKLTQNMRAKDDPTFTSFLLQLGNGSLQAEEHGNVSLPKGIVTCVDKELGDFEQLIDKVFPEIRTTSVRQNIFTKRAILTPKNDDVDKINAAAIDRFNGPSTTYKSYDSVIDDNYNTYPPEFLNTLCPTGMSPHELVLKKSRGTF